MKKQEIISILNEFETEFRTDVYGIAESQFDSLAERLSDSKLPDEIEKAQKFIQDCHADIGFMGSPEYYEKKKMLEDYFKSIEQKT